MQKQRDSTLPEQFLRPKEGAAIAGISVWRLYQAFKSENPPPFKKRFGRYILPKEEFISWASRDIIE